MKKQLDLSEYEDVGKIEHYEKKIALNSDKKRFWIGELESLKEKRYYDSLPLNASLVASKIAKKESIVFEIEENEAYEPESPI